MGTSGNDNLNIDLRNTKNETGSLSGDAGFDTLGSAISAFAQGSSPRDFDAIGGTATGNSTTVSGGTENDILSGSIYAYDPRFAIDPSTGVTASGNSTTL